MPYFAYLNQAADLIATTEALDGEAAGALPPGTSPIPGATSRVMFPVRPDLATDGSYWWDVTGNTFRPASAKLSRPRSGDEEIRRKILASLLDPEAEPLPGWLLEAAKGDGDLMLAAASAANRGDQMPDWLRSKLESVLFAGSAVAALIGR